MFGTLDTSTSGLVAQRTRAQVISANLANAQSIEGPNGEHAPFRRRIAIFSQGDPATGKAGGVHVSEIAMDQSEFRKVKMPGHRFADEDGYVAFPNVNPMMEQVNMLEASRAYEANIAAAEATKSMMQTSLRLIA